MRRSKSFGSVVLESIGVKSSCIAASLVLSTTSAMTLIQTVVWCETTSRRLTAKCTTESLTRAFVSNSSRVTWVFTHTTDAQNLLHRLKVTELVDVTTSGLSVPSILGISQTLCGVA